MINASVINEKRFYPTAKQVCVENENRNNHGDVSYFNKDANHRFVWPKLDLVMVRLITPLLLRYNIQLVNFDHVVFRLSQVINSTI